MLGIIWNLPDRSVSWIKAIEEMLDVKFTENKVSRPEDSDIFQHIENHAGFGPENSECSYHHTMELDSVIERYKAVSVVAAAESHEKEAMLSRIEKEVTTNYPDVKDQGKYIYSFKIKIYWFQKN